MSKPWTGPPLKQCPQHGHFTAAVCPVCSMPEPGNQTWEEKRHANQAKPKVPDAKPKRDKAPALERTIPGKTTGIQGIEKRHRLCVTGFRIRPLDPDNFAGGTKDIIDGLRHAGLIPGDEPWRIILETDQVRVRSLAEENTEIVIEYTE